MKRFAQATYVSSVRTEVADTNRCSQAVEQLRRLLHLAEAPSERTGMQAALVG
jgi:hypothetical protein